MYKRQGQGDLSENAEYDAAKEEQGEIESRIVVIEKMLRNAEVIDDDEVGSDVITVGSRVKIWDMEFEEEIEYSIVGSAEADPKMCIRDRCMYVHREKFTPKSSMSLKEFPS